MVVVNLVCVRLCGFDIVRDLIVLSRWVSNVEFENSAIRLGETHIHHEMLTWKERELYFGIFRDDVFAKKTLIVVVIPYFKSLYGWA